jgi:hypothetical protein
VERRSDDRLGDVRSLAFVSNNKPNVAPFFAELQRSFGVRHADTAFEQLVKPGGASTPAEPVLLDAAAGYMVVVNAVGD